MSASSSPPTRPVESGTAARQLLHGEGFTSGFLCDYGKAADRVFEAALDANRDFLWPGRAERARRPLHRLPARRGFPVRPRVVSRPTSSGGSERRCDNSIAPRPPSARGPSHCGKRIRELIEELGYRGLEDDPRRLPARAPAALPAPAHLPADGLSARRAVAVRPLRAARADPGRPRPDPPGLGRDRRARLLAGVAGALVFSKQAPDLLFGMGRCLGRLGALPEKLVWDREGAIHAGGGRPTEEFAAFCGQLAVGWLILEPADPESKGALERSHRFMRTNFEPGRRFCSELDYQAQLDAWTGRANARIHRTIRAVPAERLAEERQRMRPLPERMPETDRRFVTRVPQQPYLRFDTNDYSLDPRLAGRRVEVRVSPARAHRGRARHGRARLPPPALVRQGPDLHRPRPPARARAPARRRDVASREVELRPLARYDALIPA